MATKAEERKALEQIRKIVDKLGEESYIGKAFEGCFFVAEDNINNDFWDSLQDRISAREAELAKLRETTKLKEEKIRRITEESENGRAFMQKQVEGLNERIDKLRDDKFAAEKKAADEIKEIHIELNSGETYTGRFSEMRYINRDGFQFITVFEPCGWAVSYKLDDIKSLYID